MDVVFVNNNLIREQHLAYKKAFRIEEYLSIHFQFLHCMMAPSSFVPILFMALAAKSLATTAPPPPIGPAANLVISNKYLQPDGFNRSYVLILTLSGPGLILRRCSTVVAGGTFPGSLITGKKVKWFRIICTIYNLSEASHPG